MRQSILLLSAIFLLLSCSNNDNDTVQEEEQIRELKIKKFTITELHNDNWRKEYHYDEEAKTVQYVYTLDGVNRLQRDVSYNDIGKLEGVVAISIYQGTTELLNRTEYEYNTANQILKINIIDESGSIGEITATHFQDSIQVYRDLFADADTRFTLLFGSENKLIQKNLEPHAWNPHPTIFKYNYTNENLINIHGESNSNTFDIFFQHDDKINPLYPVFTRDYRNFILDDYGILFAFKENYSYSKNNITKQDYYGRIQTIIYQYNELGYPVSAEVTKNGQLHEILYYEYY